MAIVSLKDVKVYATFSKGFRVNEESKGRDGKDYSQRFTVWSEGIGVREGDVISLTGLLSAKVSEWTDKEGATKHSVELSLNNARLGVSGPETGHGATNMAPSDSHTGSAIWDAQAGAQQDTGSGWPVMEIRDNPWPSEDPGVPF